MRSGPIVAEHACKCTGNGLQVLAVASRNRPRSQERFDKERFWILPDSAFLWSGVDVINAVLLNLTHPPVDFARAANQTLGKHKRSQIVSNDG
jgi:hypothetical protein